jgi:hypothetical protein
MFTCKFSQSFFAVPLLALSLLTTYSAVNAKEVEVRNYTSTPCSSEKVELTRNITSLASGYLIFNAAKVNAEVSLDGKYASGKTELVSDSFAQHVHVIDRLRYDNLNSYKIRIISLLELPEKVEKSQVLKLSQACQINNTLLDNEQLRVEPAKGVFYLLSSKKSFIILRDGSYTPDQAVLLKFRLVNPRTQQIEEAVFPVGEVVDGEEDGNTSTSGDKARPPSPVVSQVQQEVQNLGKNPDTKNKGWSIEKQVKIPYSFNYPYFNVVKDAGGEAVTGEILSVEFVLK